MYASDFEFESGSPSDMNLLASQESPTIIPTSPMQATSTSASVCSCRLFTDFQAPNSSSVTFQSTAATTATRAVVTSQSSMQARSEPSQGTGETSHRQLDAILEE